MEPEEFAIRCLMGDLPHAYYCEMCNSFEPTGGTLKCFHGVHQVGDLRMKGTSVEKRVSNTPGEGWKIIWTP